MTESREVAQALFLEWMDGSGLTVIDVAERAWIAGFQSAREADTMAHREAERR